MHDDVIALLPQAAALARPPISNFKVGAVARGTSGKLYFGTNVEFAGEALSFTVHAEQSAVVNAWMSGERGIDLVGTSAAPCGYCRQFLNELATDVTVVMPGQVRKLSELLPSSFGPRDLGIEGGMLQHDGPVLTIDEEDELAQAALAAANLSYAPYSKAYAGVALRTRDGAIVSGAYAENAAFNPSLSPLQAALSQLNLRGGAWSDIAECTLVRASTLHDNATRVVLAAIGDAPLRVVAARNSA
ncbi:MAG TPA: cytidine deaminase [Thermoanaerobaculia bacterium]|jgi:cytidine deaminase|nr:cytidine deaminase [Thermoanaerobaculia bacterium]